jgi:TetR/AcrR family transcriptional regulator
MVSQRRSPGAASRDRLLSAAAAEFAARGFDGAKVDRIAARARVNKAMLYYHFGSKAGVYRAILSDLFAHIASAVAASRAQGGPPEDQLRRYIRTLAAETARLPHLPGLWLREMAEGGRHVDASIVGHLKAVLAVLAAILRDGHEAGVFRPVHPFVLQINVVAPLLLFSASAPIRERFGRTLPPGLGAATRDEVIAHVEAAALAALAAPERQTARFRR